MKRALRIVGLSLATVAIAALAVLVIAGAVTKLPGSDPVAIGETRNMSRYIEMRDGVRIAVDVWFPKDIAVGQRYPTVVHFTRYWRAQDVGFIGRALYGLGLNDAPEQLDPAIDWLNDAGYVYMIVDVRGTGASFGTRATEWAPDEIADYGEVIDWASRQAWSNGRVGTHGVSYAGNTAILAAATKHPALKIVAPLYLDFNPYLGLVKPGGAWNRYVQDWGAAVGALDRNDICVLAQASGLECLLTRLIVPGVKPVAGERAQLPDAIEAHRSNVDVAGQWMKVDFLDDRVTEAALHVADVSPYGHKADIEASGVPMVVHAGWFDAATVDGVLSQYRHFSNPQIVIIGAYSHGGEHDTDPYKATDAPVDPDPKRQFDMIRSVFDVYLKGASAPAPKPGITYYTMGSGGWAWTQQWPLPNTQSIRFDFGAEQLLLPGPATIEAGSDTYRVDRSATNGVRTRWHTNFGGADVVYDTRSAQDEKLLVYTSEPLAAPITITGNPLLTLNVEADRDEAVFIAYLEDIAPDGTVRYLSEGVLNATNRRESEVGLPYPAAGPPRSFMRSEAMPLTPGRAEEIRFPLFALSARVEAGHRLRVALAGADADMFLPLPAEGDVNWRVHRGGTRASFVELPVEIDGGSERVPIASLVQAAGR